jgi:hypothetical protein
MGKAGSEGGATALPTHLLQQPSGAAARMQRVAVVGVVSLLLTVNLMYFVKTHTTMTMLAASAGAAPIPACVCALAC